MAAAAAAGAILATLLGPISTASAEPPIAGNPTPTEGQGQAWHEIEVDIDQLAQTLIDENALAGVSISAGKDGKLVVSRAYERRHLGQVLAWEFSGLAECEAPNTMNSRPRAGAPAPPR